MDVNKFEINYKEALEEIRKTDLVVGVLESVEPIRVNTNITPTERRLRPKDLKHKTGTFGYDEEGFYIYSEQGVFVKLPELEFQAIDHSYAAGYYLRLKNNLWTGELDHNVDLRGPGEDPPDILRSQITIHFSREWKILFKKWTGDDPSEN